MNILQMVTALKLPVEQYVVFGSGPMAMRGIRSARDVDLLVTPALYAQLKNAGWEERTRPDGSHSLHWDNVEVFTTWDYGAYHPSAADLIQRAELIEGIPFAPLKDVLQWKQAYGRPKDQKDVQLIQEYLRTKHALVLPAQQ